jgi:hypothetical protein
VALAIGGAFTPYAAHVMPIVQTNMCTCMEAEYAAMIATEDRNALINGCLEACAGILQGAKGEVAMIRALLPFTEFVYNFLHKVRREPPLQVKNKKTRETKKRETRKTGGNMGGETRIQKRENKQKTNIDNTYGLGTIL